MALPRKLLGDGEHVELQLRTHIKALFLPAFLLIVLGAAVGAGVALIPAAYAPLGPLVVVVIGVVLAIWWCLVPFLRWATTTYTVTDRRLITRTGILTKTGRDLPLARVNDVSYERSLSDRILGCGTLVIQTAAEQGEIVLDDVPDVEHVHVIMSELLFSGGVHEHQD
jgi:uncharacterized membrane protein YdbT with pleckstrin-like domain